MEHGSDILLYTREGCCLCDEALAELAPALRRLGLGVRKIDIDRCAPETYYLHRYRIPVIEFRGVEVGWGKISAKEVERKLKELAAR